ncbi:MAG: hypothetical protein RIB65_13435 [Ilumatobacter fluminis]|uniref:Uncharacterized protein n=1 Tax=Ilumatobacter fluminis TaxID=467091 RepID=A0A4R7I305_9ACTN|nr:hypothetical protein [Ilumatobacter fluminis]TDT17961.1 hypothetical protein BDK89_3574 [Ilumatobacter fluminis]
MIRRRWNDLRVGQHVLVHDDDDPALSLAAGQVTNVDRATGSNEVTIRIAPVNGPERLVRPSRLAVHFDTGEPAERCWRCEMRYP